MAKYTENYNLEKPDKTEYYDIETANKNNDIIDARLFEKQDKQAGKGLSTNDFTNEYKQKIDALQKIYKYCGSADTVSDLDTIEERQIGDVYNVKDINIDYCWNGTEWTELGSAVDLTNYQTVEQANQDKQEIKDNLVVVSATEPTGEDREKVWIQNTDKEQKIYIKNDDDIYEEFINKNDLDNYSMNETKIGTWIDGKPLYRKVVQVTIPTTQNDGTTENTMSHVQNNVKMAFLAEGYFNYFNSAMPLSLYMNNSFSNGVRTSVSVGTDGVCALGIGNANTAFNDCKGYAIIKYTKTTD